MKNKILKITTIFLASLLALINVNSIIVVSINIDDRSNTNNEDIGTYRCVIAAHPEMTRTARYFEDTLLSNGWNESNILSLNDENATKTSLLNSINTIVQEDESYDTFILFIAAHGNKNGFILNSSYISYQDLDESVDELDSDAVGIIIDACYSGYAINYLQDDGRVIITNHKGIAYDSMLAEGYTMGLSGFADEKEGIGNKNCVVSLEETYNYVISEWPWNVDETNGPKIQDDYNGQLNIMFLNRKENNIDQCPNTTLHVDSMGKYQLHSTKWYAQSFIPSDNILTKARIHLKYYNSIDPITVSIRSESGGEDLTSTTLYSEDIQKYKNAYFTCDFPDINATPGNTYYLVLGMEEGSEGVYKFGISYSSNNYGEGRLYSSSSQGKGWSPVGDDSSQFFDMKFVIYSENNRNLPPNKPNKPTGNTNGNIGLDYKYTFNATDSEDDKISYYVDWGDGTTTGWTEQYLSGESITISNNWSSKGKYNVKVKAKDESDLESNWSENLSITISEPGIPDLEVSINIAISLNKVAAIVENKGDSKADNVNLSLFVEYGFLNHEKQNSTAFSDLEPDELSDSNVVDELKAFGPITVSAKATADNADTAEITASGWIIGRFIILFS